MDTLDRIEAQGMNLVTPRHHRRDALPDLTWKGRTNVDVYSSGSKGQSGAAAAGAASLAPRMVDANLCAFTARPSIFLVDAPTAPVTSTEVRARASSRSSLGSLVPETVASYINEHELYQGVA